MVMDYITFMLQNLMPDFFALLDSFYFTDGVSWMGLIVAVSLLGTLIGAVLLRV